jgi:hypothetical protein
LRSPLFCPGRLPPDGEPVIWAVGAGEDDHATAPAAAAINVRRIAVRRGIVVLRDYADVG